MTISVENIVFMNRPASVLLSAPTSDSQALVAVFDALFSDDHLGPNSSVRVNGFRFFEDPGRVAEPAIKTDRGFIRPVRATALVLAEILIQFNLAWDLLVLRKSS